MSAASLKAAPARSSRNNLPLRVGPPVATIEVNWREVKRMPPVGCVLLTGTDASGNAAYTEKDLAAARAVAFQQQWAQRLGEFWIVLLTGKKSLDPDQRPCLSVQLGNAEGMTIVQFVHWEKHRTGPDDSEVWTLYGPGLCPRDQVKDVYVQRDLARKSGVKPAQKERK